MKRALSYKDVAEWLRYDPDSGNLYWLKGQKGVFAGAVAGYRMPRHRKSYIQVGFDKKIYYAHKIAWLLMTKKWPVHHIDHKNLDGGDNRWKNLRACTMSQNVANQNRHFDRINDLPKGVYFAKNATKRPYYSRIFVRGKDYRLGYFTTVKEAQEAYRAASRKFYGEFARD